MCIIVDVNAISSVFNPKAEDHSEFKPVLNWIVDDIGFMIYGGTKFKQELSKLQKYLGFLLELKRVNKVRECNKDVTDEAEEQIKQTIQDADFDDPHLAAIVKVTGCRLICSKDTRSVKYIQNKTLYNKGTITPKYYTGKRNSRLLCINNIPDKFRPPEKLNKAAKDKLNLK